MLTAAVVFLGLGLLAIAVVIGAGLIGAPDAEAAALGRELRRLARQRSAVAILIHRSDRDTWTKVGAVAALCNDADRFAAHVRAYLRVSTTSVYPES